MGKMQSPTKPGVTGLVSSKSKRKVGHTTEDLPPLEEFTQANTEEQFKDHFKNVFRKHKIKKKQAI